MSATSCERSGSPHQYSVARAEAVGERSTDASATISVYHREAAERHLPDVGVRRLDVPMSDLWDERGPGIVRFPSGRLIRGRSYRRPLPPGPLPTLTVFLRGTPPEDVDGDSRWIRWPDFWLPRDRATAT